MHEIFVNSIFHELFRVPSYATMNVDEEYDFDGAVRRTLSILEPSRTRSALWSQFSDWSSFRQGSFYFVDLRLMDSEGFAGCLN